MNASCGCTNIHTLLLSRTQSTAGELDPQIPPTQCPPNENKQINNDNVINGLKLIDFFSLFFSFSFLFILIDLLLIYLSHPSNVWPSMVNLHKQGGWLAHQASYRSGWTASFDYIGSSTNLVNSWRWPNQSLISVEWV